MFFPGHARSHSSSQKNAVTDTVKEQNQEKRNFFKISNITSTERDPEPEFIAQKLDMVCDDLEVGACEEVVPDKNCFSAALFSKQLSIPSSGS